MTPVDLLATSRRLLQHPDAKTAGIWPRAAALLARQALEQSLDDFWKAEGLGLDRLSTRPQLICLRRILSDKPLAMSLTHAWNALSQACHHHAYELPPTTAELLGWMEITEKWASRSPSAALPPARAARL